MRTEGEVTEVVGLKMEGGAPEPRNWVPLKAGKGQERILHRAARRTLSRWHLGRLTPLGRDTADGLKPHKQVSHNPGGSESRSGAGPGGCLACRWPPSSCVFTWWGQLWAGGVGKLAPWYRSL